MLADDSSKETFSNEVISVDTAPVLNVESEVKEGIMNQRKIFFRVLEFCFFCPTTLIGLNFARLNFASRKIREFFWI